MENLKTFGKLVGLLVVGVLLGVLIFLFAFWFFMFVLGVLCIFFLAWAVGAPIAIKERGVKTGYIRWFTFYPINKTRQ